ncbi:unnamed protein product [Rotaria sordida]|uniref:F-box domain-containing protein n=1 Tax=Rotaria sordida TaxID=392033 RepID=A0A819WVE6_9BILA|nr:unnamed protein product [Rotaria sordida]
MINTLESLANEILLNILSNLTWFEIIESFWSINKRFNSLVCSIFSINYDRNKTGIIINEIDLSLNKYQSILLSIISNSNLSISIQRIYIDGRKSVFFDLISKWIFQENLIRFINLKSLILTRCFLSEILINNLSLLIQYQLDELILTIDKDSLEMFYNKYDSGKNARDQVQKLRVMYQEFIRQLFSSKCQLTSLRLDISQDNSLYQIHKCFSSSSSSDIYSNQIDNQLVTNCMTLRRLHIHVIHGYFIEHIIEHVPALKILSVVIEDSLAQEQLYHIKTKKFSSTIVNWYDKIPKLKCFTLYSHILVDLEFVYLKWILNSVNYVEKLKLRLHVNLTYQEDSMKRHYFIDANFINEYCLPDISKNLIIFNFYIRFKCQLLSDNNIQIIENSFKIHRFFIDHHWIKVKCFFDSIMSYQHISSTGMIKPKFFNSIKNYSHIFDWYHMKSLEVDLCPSIDLVLEQFDILFPHITSIQFNMG